MKKKGFTLIEVLVSVIIIMILATYSVLKYTESIHDGENRTAKAQMELVIGAYKQYLMEHPETPLSGQVSYQPTLQKCQVGEEGQEHSGTFDCPKLNINNIHYKITIGTETSSPSCGGSIGVMTAVGGAGTVGAKFASGYCAYIDRFGRAVDGTTSAE